MEILFDALIALPFVAVFLLGLGVALVVAQCSRSLGAGLVILALGYVAGAVMLGDVGFRLGITIYMQDITLGLVAVAALLRYVFLVEARPKALPLIALVLVFTVNLAQGLVVFGTAAGVSARPTFYALAACVYVMTFPMNERRLRALFVAFVWCGLALFLLACYRGVAVALDLRDLLPPSGSFQPRGHSVWRVIASAESLVVAQAVISLWAFAGLAPGVLTALRLLAPALLAATVMLQHRSVWFATIAGYVALRHGRGARLLDANNILLVLVLAAILGLGSRFAGSDSGVGGDVARSTRDAIELTGTASARLGGWKSLMQQWTNSGPRTWAIGQPYGTSTGYYTSDDLGARKVSWQPHNYYIELLTSLGLLGLLSFLSVVGMAVLGLWRARAHPEHGLAAHWLLVMLAFQMTYYLTYGVDYLQALSLGAALSLAAARGAAAKPAGGRALSHGASLVRRAP